MSLGTKAISQKTGRSVTLAAGDEIKWLPIGVAIAWDKISAAVSATTLTDDTPIAVGDKYLRYGSIMVPIKTKTVQTLTVSGSPTGGKTTATYTILGTDYEIDVNYDDTAAEVATSLNTAFGGPFDVVAVSGSAGSYTLTFDVRARNVPVATLVDAYTGGSSPEAAAAVTTAGDADNRYWNKWNGSDALVRDQVGLLNETIVMGGATLKTGYVDTDLTGLIRGGIVWGERIDATAAQIATLQTAMPELRLAPTQ